MNKKNEEVKLDFTSENLAVPEVHTGKVEETEKLKESGGQPEEPISVQFDTLAVPEIRLGRGRNGKKSSEPEKKEK